MGGEKEMSGRSIIDDEEYVTFCGLKVLHDMGFRLVTSDGKSINELFENDNGD